MSNRLLLIAFHFPPIQGSTGVTRTLSFAKYLQESDWEVTVLTADPKAYPQSRSENLGMIPAHVRVERAFALDTQRHLSIAGRYPLALAIPDRWQSWIAGGLIKTASIIRTWQPSVVMSTYPIASAHYLGYLVHKFYRLPWVADFRDPMAQEGYPSEPKLQRAYRRIERRVFANAARVLATTLGCAELYRARYAHFPPEHVEVIPNGFDEELFPPRGADHTRPRNPQRKLCLLHSGVLYPSERDPEAFLNAVAELRDEGLLPASEVEFRLRATAHDDLYLPLIERLRLGELVRLMPAIPYKEALGEMSEVDACMVFQGSNCNEQVPAKVYEYLYAGRPILGLTELEGDTGRILRDFGVRDIASLHDVAAIKRALPTFLEKVRNDTFEHIDRTRVMRFSRRQTAAALGKLLDGVQAQARTASPAAPQPRAR